MLLFLREEDLLWPQFKCQRRHQRIKIPFLPQQWIHLQRLLFSLSEDRHLHHTVGIIVISAGTVVLWHFVRVDIVAFHKYLLQRQKSKKPDRWGAVLLPCSMLALFFQMLLKHMRVWWWLCLSKGSWGQYATRVSTAANGAWHLCCLWSPSSSAVCSGSAHRPGPLPDQVS